MYQRSLEIELARRGHTVRREVPFALSYEGVPLGHCYRADLVCDDVLIETKAHAGLSDADVAQVIHYLRCSKLRRGLLFNFGLPSLQIRRFVNGWDDAAAQVAASDSAGSAQSAAPLTGPPPEPFTSRARPTAS